MGSPKANTLSTIEKKYPAYATAIRVAYGVVMKGLNALDYAYPIGEHIYEKVVEASSPLREHGLQYLWPLLIGFCVCFFGGCYTLLITSVEVVYLTTWDTVRRNLSTLYANYCAAREASLKDDLLDEDQNGVPDVQEISRNELFSRKLGVFLRSVDPVGLKEAFHGLIFAVLAVLAALKSRFANALVFACGLANAMGSHFPLKDFIEDFLPPEQKKLADAITFCTLNFIGVTIATVLQRHVMALHCALRGATMLVGNAIAFGKEAGLVEEGVAISSQRSSALVGALACMGFLWQASNGFSAPFPFNILLFPLSLAEWLLGAIFTATLVSGVV
ncbi:hypothetical protein TraAM80_01922 [Trypanosoma rangeli]|uniref:Uncharacterized protein n=1 Tax=Trypanosoma rangeli TaxID=5698 RepID=A0A422NWG5_TRYRA|nr:uncharacterized protein TraAM80_01922 [Trypanosoma rangeli]RNF09788.1 hypothetical protein TraAM80_01922 [Trypanosoma rangeli]|eukprot:RNF09788.1 hypothetical protein TraAM80_01922 [Trypanosoma rangeli]